MCNFKKKKKNCLTFQVFEYQIISMSKDVYMYTLGKLKTNKIPNTNTRTSNVWVRNPKLNQMLYSPSVVLQSFLLSNQDLDLNCIHKLPK